MAKIDTTKNISKRILSKLNGKSNRVYHFSMNRLSMKGISDNEYGNALQFRNTMEKKNPSLLP